MSKFNIGDVVMSLDEKGHVSSPWWYPAVGTEGVVVEINGGVYRVDWGTNSGCEENWSLFQKLMNIPMTKYGQC